MLVFYSKTLPASNPLFWPDYWKAKSDDVTEKFMPEYAAFRRHVSPGAKVLDAGCGTGYVTRTMLRQGYSAVGIDFDEQSVTRSARERGYFPAAVADVTTLPYGDAFFDSVFLCSVAEHVPAGAESAIRECTRVLRPGGMLILTLPYVNIVRKLYSPLYHIREKLRRQAPVHFDQYVYTRGEVVRLLRNCGLEVVECRRTHYMTVLLRIPGMNALHHAIFAQRPATAAGAPSGGGSREKGSGSTVKRLVRKSLETFFNLMIPNRLTVVARRSAAPAK